MHVPKNKQIMRKNSRSDTVTDDMVFCPVLVKYWINSRNVRSLLEFLSKFQTKHNQIYDRTFPDFHL